AILTRSARPFVRKSRLMNVYNVTIKSLMKIYIFYAKNVKELKERKSVCDSFRAYCRKKLPSESTTLPRSLWVYYESMQFLLGLQLQGLYVIYHTAYNILIILQYSNNISYSVQYFNNFTI
ncbi:hypothetical protein ALC60_10532, partial [Trachymyrmex zeteki]